jgi:hypothetical protein
MTATAAAAAAVRGLSLLQADVAFDRSTAGGGSSSGGDSGGGGVSVGAVLVLTLLMAAASGLGALPFFFVGRLSAKLAGVANALACGVMLAASFDLVHEGEPYGAGYVILGVCVGAIFIACMQRALHGCEDVKFAALEVGTGRPVRVATDLNPNPHPNLGIRYQVPTTYSHLFSYARVR